MGLSNLFPGSTNPALIPGMAAHELAPTILINVPHFFFFYLELLDVTLYIASGVIRSIMPKVEISAHKKSLHARISEEKKKGEYK